LTKAGASSLYCEDPSLLVSSLFLGRTNEPSPPGCTIGTAGSGGRQARADREQWQDTLLSKEETTGRNTDADNMTIRSREGRRTTAREIKTDNHGGVHYLRPSRQAFRGCSAVPTCPEPDTGRTLPALPMQWDGVPCAGSSSRLGIDGGIQTVWDGEHYPSVRPLASYTSTHRVDATLSYHRPEDMSVDLRGKWIGGEGRGSGERRRRAGRHAGAGGSGDRCWSRGERGRDAAYLLGTGTDIGLFVCGRDLALCIL
jgi:hypothetical protein